MWHCSECFTEFTRPRTSCSDCGGDVVEGASPRYTGEAVPDRPSSRPVEVDDEESPIEVAADREGPNAGVPLVRVRGADAALVLADVLSNERIEVGWTDGRMPSPGGDPGAIYELRVPFEELPDAQAVIAEWADTETLVPEGMIEEDVVLEMADEGGDQVAAPDAAVEEEDVAEDEPLPDGPSLRHCPSCGAEYESARRDCSDCGTDLVNGPSTRYRGR